MKIFTLILGLILSLNSFAQVISDFVVVKQNVELEGGRAEDLYDALNDIHDAICNDDGCKQVVSMAICTRMTQPLEFDQCSVGFEGRNDNNEPVVGHISAAGKHARNLMDAIVAVTHPECAGEMGMAVCSTPPVSMNCTKTGPWYWHSYKCNLEL